MPVEMVSFRRSKHSCEPVQLSMTKAQVKEIGDQRCILLVTHVSTKLPTLFLRHDRGAFVKEESSCNSMYWVSLPEILVLASLLRTVFGRAEADTNGAGLLG